MNGRTIRRVGLVLIGLLWLAVDARAQEQPVVFVHGLKSDSVGWVDTAARLRGALLIDVRTPNLNWRRSYQDQANELSGRPELAGLPAAPILVGHSNGGIVSREWTRSHAAGGVVTLGTPHGGAPLLPHFFQWASYHSATSPLLNEVLGAFSSWTDWTWLFPYFANALNYMSDYSIWSVFSLAATLGLDAAMPVTAQMHPYSSYLSGLNSWDNQSREYRDVPGRAGIVSVASNFYWAGPARAVAPEAADAVAAAIYGAAFATMYWGQYILVQADPMDLESTRQGLSLLSVAGHILSIDPIYCRFVSSADLSECIANDGVVPFTSQEYPGAPNLYIDGPAHIQERQQSDAALYQALVWYTHAAVRSAPPSSPGPVYPPPPPADPPPPDSGSSSPPVDTPPIPGPDPTASLQQNQRLHAGESIWSSNGLYRLRYDESGDLVLFDVAGGYSMWRSGTQGSSPGIAVMQDDGNFVIYDINGQPCWWTGTDVNPGAFLIVQDDGNVVVYDGSLRALWNTGTWR